MQQLFSGEYSEACRWRYLPKEQERKRANIAIGHLPPPTTGQCLEVKEQNSGYFTNNESDNEILDPDFFLFKWNGIYGNINVSYTVFIWKINKIRQIANKL